MDNSEVEHNLIGFRNIFLLENREHDGPGELEIAQFLRESCYVRSVFPVEVHPQLMTLINIISNTLYLFYVKLLIQYFQVWSIILCKITATEDLLSLSNSSTYFRQFFIDKLQTLLFHKVVAALAPQYEKREASHCYREEAVPVPDLAPDYFEIHPNEDPDYYFTSEDEDIFLEPDSGFEEGRWHHRSGMESSRFRMRETVKIPHKMKGLMKCRLVCSAWNKAIENYYQGCNKLENISYFGQHLEVQNFDCFNKRNTPRRFLEHCEETHNQPLLKKNPFLGRLVQINGNLPSKRVERRFTTYLRLALVAFGEEIWYCKVIMPFDVAIKNGTCTQLYLWLQEWLSLMPNLRKLVIESYRNGESFPKLEDIQRLDMEIRANSMPTLEHLEILDVDGVLAQISNEIIRANNHISGLRLKKKGWCEEISESFGEFKYISEFGYKLPENSGRLRALEIVPFAEELLRNFEKEVRLASDLETLKVRYFKSSPLDWERVLNVIGKQWGESLKELTLKIGPHLWMNTIDVERRQFLEMSSGCELRLQKLEKITVYLYQPMQLDFLLSVKSTLKFICFVMRYSQGKDYDRYEQKQRIEFFGFEECMGKSNIWNVFEKLKVVQVRNDWKPLRMRLTSIRRPRK